MRQPTGVRKATLWGEGPWVWSVQRFPIAASCVLLFATSLCRHILNVPGSLGPSYIKWDARQADMDGPGRSRSAISWRRRQCRVSIVLLARCVSPLCRCAAGVPALELVA